jgi:catechol 2,3-dioxygenase-like lactoylglutathione lyase family enzyme
MAALKAIDHVGLTVRDLDSAIGWFDRALGLTVARTLEFPDGTRSAFLHGGGDVGVELFEVAEPRSGIQNEDPAGAARVLGYGHLALAVEDVDALFAVLVEAGAAPVWPPATAPEGDRRVAFVHDPDGNLIELVQVVGRTPAGASGH